MECNRFACETRKVDYAEINKQESGNFEEEKTCLWDFFLKNGKHIRRKHNETEIWNSAIEPHKYENVIYSGNGITKKAIKDEVSKNDAGTIGSIK